jgi:hypothetical protein
MSTEIGEVNINLRLSLKNFQDDVKTGSNAAQNGARDMANAFSSSSREAQGSLALIGDEIGVTIPRHLRTFITTIPGVGAALNAAFSSVALLAFIELITKIVEKVQEWEDRAKVTAEAMEALSSGNDTAFRKLDEEILGLSAHIDELRGIHLTALQKQLQLIDMQKFDSLTSQFDGVQQRVDKVFDSLNIGGVEGKFLDMFGLGDNDKVKSIKLEYDDILSQANQMKALGMDSAEIYSMIDYRLKTAVSSLSNQKDETSRISQALQTEIGALQALETIYDKVNAIATDKEKVLTLEDMNKNAIDIRGNIEAAAEALKKLNDASIAPNVLMKMGTAPIPIGAGPAYGGTKEALDMVRLQEDQNDQLERGRDLYTATRTESEKYAQEMQVLNLLLAEGAIDQDTYNRSVTQAKEKYDAVTQGLHEIGQTVGQDIAQAALYGGSWTKAFQDIAAEIVKVVIQMTLLKSLQQSAASSGSGFMGFLSSLVGGFSGKAVGGPVYQGDGYIVGEQGPEFFSPTTSGQIIPGVPSGSSGPKAVTNNYDFTFNGVTDMDSFKQSKSQIAAEMAAQLSLHARRNS